MALYIMAYIVYIVMALYSYGTYIVMALCSYGLYSLYSYGPI